MPRASIRRRNDIEAKALSYAVSDVVRSGATFRRRITDKGTVEWISASLRGLGDRFRRSSM